MKLLASIYLATAVVATQLNAVSQKTDQLWEYVRKLDGKEKLINSKKGGKVEIAWVDDLHKLIEDAAAAGVNLGSLHVGSYDSMRRDNQLKYLEERYTKPNFRDLLIYECDQDENDHDYSNMRYCENQLIPNLEQYVADVLRGPLPLKDVQEDLAKLKTDKGSIEGLLKDIFSKTKTMAQTLEDTEREYRTSADKTKEQAGEMAKQAQRTEETAEQ